MKTPGCGCSINIKPYLKKKEKNMKERKKKRKNLGHDDPSKPSHRLTNGPKPSKTIEIDGSKTKNH